VRVVCDTVLVMRQGVIVEAGPCAELFANPRHPSTRQLFRAVPLPVVDPGWLSGASLEEETAPPAG
jgi:ABC-type dipeptide/oligopeptide/nickel transport system ATPase component